MLHSVHNWRMPLGNLREKVERVITLRSPDLEPIAHIGESSARALCPRASAAGRWKVALLGY
jgi:hypothetical protein